MLTGQKVTLRAVQREDVPRIWELTWADIEVESRLSTKPPLPRSLARMEAEFEKDLEDPSARIAYFAIEANGELIGACGLWGIDHDHRLANLGIGIGQPYWGKGFGTETVRMLVDYGFRHLNLRRIQLTVLADDDRAVGAYRSAGFIEEGRLRERDFTLGASHDILVMGLLRPEWDGATQPPPAT